MLERLLEDALNAYGETITRTKGITLLMKQKSKTPVVKVSGRTGEVKTKLLWRTASTVVASVRTRLTEWMLVPKKLAQQTLERPQMLEQHALETVGIKQRYLQEKEILETARLAKVAEINTALPA